MKLPPYGYKFVPISSESLNESRDAPPKEVYFPLSQGSAGGRTSAFSPTGRAAPANDAERALALEILQHSQSVVLVNLRYLDTAFGSLRLAEHEREAFSTNGECLYYNPSYVLALFAEEPSRVARDLLHTVLHCVFHHLFVHGSMHPVYWDLACDLAVEYLIEDIGLPATTCIGSSDREEVFALLRSKLTVPTAQSIYRYLKESALTVRELEAIRRHFFADDHTLWYIQQNPSGAQQQKSEDTSGEGGSGDSDNTEAEDDSSDSTEPQESTDQDKSPQDADNQQQQQDSGDDNSSNDKNRSKEDSSRDRDDSSNATNDSRSSESQQESSDAGRDEHGQDSNAGEDGRDDDNHDDDGENNDDDSSSQDEADPKDDSDDGDTKESDGSTGGDEDGGEHNEASDEAGNNAGNASQGAQGSSVDEVSGFDSSLESEHTVSPQPQDGPPPNTLHDAGNKEQWQRIAERMEVDLETLSKSQGDTAANLVRALKALNREKYDYASFLRQFAVLGETMQINDEEFDYLFYTYGLKLYDNMPLVEPLEYKETRKIREFVIALDTSASTSGKLVESFMRKTYTMLKQTENFFSKVNVHIIQCDMQIQEAVRIENDQQFDHYLKTLKIRGMGGTDFRPVFDHVNRLLAEGEFNRLGGLIYFTDGLGTFPKQKPPYKTAFVFIDNGELDPEVPIWAIKLLLESEDL